jgi:hypothetical protein
MPWRRTIDPAKNQLRHGTAAIVVGRCSEMSTRLRMRLALAAKEDAVTRLLYERVRGPQLAADSTSSAWPGQWACTGETAALPHYPGANCRRRPASWAASIRTAMLLRLVQLPGTAAFAPLSAALVVHVIALNGTAGVASGALYSYGLGPMASHFSFDALA